MPAQSLQLSVAQKLHAAGMPDTFALDKNLALQLYRSGNAIWLEENKGLIIQLANEGITKIAKMLTLPKDAQISLIPIFTFDQGVARHKILVIGGTNNVWYKKDEYDLCCQFQKKLNEIDDVMLPVALIAQLRQFGQLTASTSSAGELSNLEVRSLAAAPDKNSLLFADQIEDLHNPGAIAAVRSLVVRDFAANPKDLGLRAVRTPMLMLPLTLQHLVAEQVYQTEVLRRVMLSEWGQTPGDNRRDPTSRYFYNQDLWGIDRAGVDGQKVEYFGRTGDYATSIPWKKITDDKYEPSLSLEAVSLRTQHLASLARDLAPYLSSRLRVKDLPHDYPNLEKVAQRDLGVVFEQAKILDQVYSIVDCLKTVSYFDADRMDEFKSMHAGLWRGISNFNQEHLKLSEKELEHLLFFGTSAARWNVVLSYFIDTYGNFKISTQKIDDLVQYFGVARYIDHTAQTKLEADLRSLDQEKTWQDWFQKGSLSNAGVLNNPTSVDFFPLNCMLKYSMSQPILDGFIDRLVIHYASEFQVETMLSDADSPSFCFHIWPADMEKTLAESKDKLFRLEIKNQNGLGSVTLSRRDLARIRHDAEMEQFSNSLRMIAIGAATMLTMGELGRSNEVDFLSQGTRPELFNQKREGDTQLFAATDFNKQERA